MGHRFQQRDHLIGHGPIVHAHRQLDAPQLVCERPVGYLLGDEMRIRDDDIGSLAGVHDAGSDANPAHHALQRPQFDHVAHMDGPLKE